MKRTVRRIVSYIERINKYVFFVVLIMICMVALSVGIYAQFFYKYADTDPLMLGINIGDKKTAEEYAILESNFNELFTNSLSTNVQDFSNIEKIDSEKDMVYTAYNLVNEDETYYNVDAKIPEINIESDIIKKINSEIKSEYYNKANSIMRQNEENVVYQVSYSAFINSDILSVVIKTSLKEQGKSEKVSIKTYTYSFSQDKIVSLADLIKSKKTTNEVVQSSIDSEIKKTYENAQIIANQYGTLYERDLKSDIYKLENSNNYFLTDDGYVYIIYAYGNDHYTNEMDIVIF